MKVKVGQYVRLKDKRFCMIVGVLSEENQYIDILTNDGVRSCLKLLIVKVADDPRELIEVGDLVYLKCVEQPILVTKGNLKYYFNSNETYSIIEILTPNSNGGYDLQYEEGLE